MSDWLSFALRYSTIRCQSWFGWSVSFQFAGCSISWLFSLLNSWYLWNKRISFSRFRLDRYFLWTSLTNQMWSHTSLTFVKDLARLDVFSFYRVFYLIWCSPVCHVSCLYFRERCIFILFDTCDRIVTLSTPLSQEIVLSRCCLIRNLLVFNWIIEWDLLLVSNIMCFSIYHRWFKRVQHSGLLFC